MKGSCLVLVGLIYHHPLEGRVTFFVMSLSFVVAVVTLFRMMFPPHDMKISCSFSGPSGEIGAREQRF